MARGSTEPWTVLLCNVVGSRVVYPGLTTLADPSTAPGLRSQLEACVGRSSSVVATCAELLDRDVLVRQVLRDEPQAHTQRCQCHAGNQPARRIAARCGQRAGELRGRHRPLTGNLSRRCGQGRRRDGGGHHRGGGYHCGGRDQRRGGYHCRGRDQRWCATVVVVAAMVVVVAAAVVVVAASWSWWLPPVVVAASVVVVATSVVVVAAAVVVVLALHPQHRLVDDVEHRAAAPVDSGDPLCALDRR